MAILYSNALIDRIEKRLRDTFRQPNLQLNRRSGRKTGSFHVAVTEDFINVTRIGDGRFALEILTEGIHRDTYYFGFVALFRSTSGISDTFGHELQHVSLNILQKFPGGDLYPLFRAEWDELVASDPTSCHAQPHWHFVLSPSAIESVIIALGGQSVDFGTERVFDKMVSPAGAHFAMSPLWNPRDEDSHKQKFDSEKDFAAWFDKLVLYVASQLVYVCSGFRQEDVREFNLGMIVP